jgi:dTDP-D-glucose 4,6-dehydratase
MMASRVFPGKNLTLYGKGKLVSDYVYVDDVLHAFLNIFGKYGTVE